MPANGTIKDEQDTTADAELRIVGIGGIPEVQPGDDLVGLIADGIIASGQTLRAGDIVVVTHKIVSKAEGRLVDLTTVEPSPFAIQFAAPTGKDARQVEVVLRESVRISRMDAQRGVIISETRHGFICANAAVDASNVSPDIVCLLPEDPDGSAARIREGLADRFGLTGDEAPGVIVSDSFGRAWRAGIINVAVGVAGLAPLADYRGQHDPNGYELRASILAVGDELASAAELVQHKLDARPVTLIRGYIPRTDTPHGTGRDLVMPPERDLYR
ncbi:MAG TPA: coenzyme F420-0:L-glutamate ligase [Thermomicrobiales bacterium]|jgi:coenzyme F420-0:L-glutamate ligase/coenzyme F420-1:gamma-L-glutamate ligase|nr:coenzyme F420-0:L-glutamate ligase [Thermomicrobiales bacterium]